MGRHSLRRRFRQDQDPRQDRQPHREEAPGGCVCDAGRSDRHPRQAADGRGVGRGPPPAPQASRRTHLYRQGPTGRPGRPRALCGRRDASPHGHGAARHSLQSGQGLQRRSRFGIMLPLVRRADHDDGRAHGVHRQLHCPGGDQAAAARDAGDRLQCVCAGRRAGDVRGIPRATRAA